MGPSECNNFMNKNLMKWICRVILLPFYVVGVVLFSPVIFVAAVVLVLQWLSEKADVL